MKYPAWLTTIFYVFSNFLMAIIPRRTPSQQQLQQTKIMAHRGVHDNIAIKENTLLAFEKAYQAGVWALEMDIRWTKDLQPVVHHDTNTQRVFGKNINIGGVILAELQQQIPEIPTLQQVVEQFGKKIVLLIELKDAHYTNPKVCNEQLQTILSDLIPTKDFYFISLIPDVFEVINVFPCESYFPIGQVDMQRMNQLALDKHYAGIMGHYVFTKTAYVQEQLSHGKQVATGFVDSKNCLFREINRGVNIISTNDPVKIQQMIDQYKHG